MTDIDKALGSIPFVIKELEPGQEPEKILYYEGDMVEDRIEVINGVEYKFYGRRSMNRARQKVVNVGTVGHVDFGRSHGHIGWTPSHGEYDYNGGPFIQRSAWARGTLQTLGRHGYKTDLTELISNMPYREVRSIHNVQLSDSEVMELWLNYMRITEGSAGDYDIAKYARGARKKEDPTYLSFENGGLIVAGRVIWILPDEQYTKFHKHAADWTMPTKDYIKSVVNQYYILKDFQEKHNPIIAHVQGVDIRKSDVANGWGAYAGKLMIPEYKRNSDGSYLVDEQGNKVPTGREVEGIKINMNEVFGLEAPK